MYITFEKTIGERIYDFFTSHMIFTMLLLIFNLCGVVLGISNYIEISQDVVAKMAALSFERYMFTKYTLLFSLAVNAAFSIFLSSTFFNRK